MFLIRSLSELATRLEAEAYEYKRKAARSNRLEAAFFYGQAAQNRELAARLRSLFLKTAPSEE